MANIWKSTRIKRDNGEEVEGNAPVIISASRSTDIPAFYSKWLVNRLKKGYVVWYNPFNRVPSYISFDNARLFVFWTKNSKPLMPYLKKFDDKKINYYFQYTLNDYETEGFEPNLPAMSERINTFKALSEQIGKEKVIWRFDPLIITPQLTPRDLLTKIWRLGKELKHQTDKLVFSFVDVKAYKKVQNNMIRELNFFSKESVCSAEPRKEQIEEIAEGLFKIKKAWKKEGWDIKMATCGEKMNLSEYGIEKNKCIDDDLIVHEFGKNIDLINFVKYGTTEHPKPIQNDLPFDSNKNEPDPYKKNMKDKGQRKECGCIYSKDIGMYNTCRHFCVYCYANTSKKAVENNANKHSTHSESIIQ